MTNKPGQRRHRRQRHLHLFPWASVDRQSCKVIRKMRGLAFPTNAAFDRETSYDHGTPSAKVDDIPIDPALSGPAIEPAILGGENGMNDAPVSLHGIPTLRSTRRVSTRGLRDIRVRNRFNISFLS